MRFLFDLITSIVLAPFRLIRFIVADVLIFGVIGGMISLVKGMLRIIFRPFTLLLIAAGAVVFFYATEEQKKKAKALMGM
ncbi:MAG: hypothetical protein MUD15_05760 [Desulfobacterota bacterium]|jgi:hypothetical protein|nr:hypothetical protein [Thermodesulfobacteriota bacterium]